MVRLGLLVNPDAGLGGRLGLKGSDGQAELARSLGAEDRSGPRMTAMLVHFSTLHRAGFDDVEWLTSEGRMGTQWLPEGANIGTVSTVHASSGATTASDTAKAVAALLDAGIDLLVYAGGDGTTRDIVAALESAGQPKTPVIGVPTGVKMHSGCFAASPKAAAEVLSAWLNDDLLLASTEVLDLDEERYRAGEWVVQLYAEAITPASPRWMQGSKQRIEAADEDDITEGLADHIGELLITDDRLIIWGSGGTLRTIGETNGFEPTNLGIDATVGSKQVGTDLDETGLLGIISSLGPGHSAALADGRSGLLDRQGQSATLARGSPCCGIDNILGVVTPAKLLTVRTLRVETGDEALDAEFAAKRYMKVLQGYRTTRVLPVSVD